MFRTNLFSTIFILHQYQIVIEPNGARFKETSGEYFQNRTGGQRKADFSVTASTKTFT